MFRFYYFYQFMKEMEDKIFGYSDIIAFDLETTGLDPYADCIIEIGAVKYSPDGKFQRFDTFVNPNRPVPFYVMQLTGIDNDMLKDAPQIDDALAEFLEFIGDSALIAHNAPFDVNFTNAKLTDIGHPPLNNPVIDTLPLVRLLYPNSVNHQLETIAGLFGYDLTKAHRAVEDAEATLYSAIGLWKTILALDEKVFDRLEFLIGYANKADLLEIWAKAREERLLKHYDMPEIVSKYILDLTNEFGEPPSEEIEFDPEEVMHYFDKDSPLKSIMSDFKYREQQENMAMFVVDALVNGKIVMVEAGTGVGKSFAYLIPALYWAVANGEKVVVSTYTKALQEQLFFYDIPFLEKILPFSFKSVLLKGKGNYICLLRVERYIKNPSLLSFKEREGILYIANWLANTHSGDISENSAFMNSRQFHLWEKIRADGHTCIGRKCPYFNDCFVYKIRRKVQESQLIVVNHALLLSDLGGGILGDYDYLIVDEAHNLERVASDAFGGVVARWRIRSTLDSIFSEMPQPNGTLAFLFSALENRQDYADLYKISTNSIVSARAFADNFFNELTEQMEYAYHWREQQYGVRKRYDPDNAVFRKIENLGAEMVRYLNSVRDNLKKFYESIEVSNEKIERTREELKGETAKINDIIEELLTAMSPTERDYVYWFESPRPNDDVNAKAKMCFAPLNIGEILHNSIYKNIGSAIFTSATLTVAKKFDYYLDTLGFNLAPPDRVGTLLLGSPYDYDNQLKIAIAKFMPRPDRGNEKIFTQRFTEIIWETSRRFRSGTLALFTSYNMLKNVFFELHPKFKSEGIRLLGQSLSGSHSAIRRQFIEDTESVLLGTESFWQGVNVPGKSLELLFIAKLPFGVPGEPYADAKQEQISMRGGNPFMEYVVPQAVIRFRQGIGRLIRTETDRGVLVVFDKRISQTRYGENFLDSLPTEAIEVNSPIELFNLIDEQLGENN